MVGTTKVELKGGPHGHDTELWIDGVKQHGVHRVELDVDVKDVVRVRTFQFAEAIVAVDGDVANAFTVRVNLHGEEGWQVLASSTADTIWQALYDCAKQLELAAKGEAGSTET